MIWPLLTNWKLLGLLAGTIAVMGMVIWIQALRNDNRSLKTELETCQANYSQMMKVREAERNVSTEYQSKNAALQSQLRNANRVRKCVPVRMPETPSGHSGPTAGAIVSSGNGLDSGYLVDFAGRCESVRLKLLSCQAFCG